MKRRFNDLSDAQLLARIYLNLKGAKKKRDEWITIARLVEELVARKESLPVAAKTMDVSVELTKSILSLLTLPDEIMRSIASGEIGFDVGQRLARVRSRQRQKRIAAAIKGLSSHDARQVILFSKQNPLSEPHAFALRVSQSKQQREKVHLVVLPIRDGLYRGLDELARKRKIPVSQLLLSVVRDAVATQGGSPQ